MPKTPKIKGGPKKVGLNRLIIAKLFFRYFEPERTEIEFARDDYEWALAEIKKEKPDLFRKAAQAVAMLDEVGGEAPIGGIVAEQTIEKHKNIGAVIYDFRFRRSLPDDIKATEKPAENLFWRIKLAGKGRYKFILGPPPIVVPDESAKEVKVFESTPAIIEQFALDDEQALLAKVRYNRLIDTFLAITASSLQNHLRTFVEDVGQIEIDELYVGQDSDGTKYVVPVQAKGRRDKLSIVQTEQDAAFCAARKEFRGLKARPVSAQFLPDGRVHLFEFEVDAKQNVTIRDERRFRFIRAKRKRDTRRRKSAKR